MSIWHIQANSISFLSASAPYSEMFLTPLCSLSDFYACKWHSKKLMSARFAGLDFRAMCMVVVSLYFSVVDFSIHSGWLSWLIYICSNCSTLSTQMMCTTGPCRNADKEIWILSDRFNLPTCQLGHLTSQHFSFTFCFQIMALCSSFSTFLTGCLIAVRFNDVNLLGTDTYTTLPALLIETVVLNEDLSHSLLSFLSLVVLAWMA